MVRTVIWAATLLGVLHPVLAPSVLWADEGRIPIHKPTTITEPGQYIVTRDIVAHGQSVITIASSDVTLNLGGHILRVVDYATCPGVIVIDPEFGGGELSIRNGRIMSDASSDCGAIRTHGGIFGPKRVVIHDIEANGALYVAGAQRVEIMRCYIHDSSGGIVVTGNGDFLYTGHFLNNTMERISNDAFLLSDLKGGIVKGNIVRDSGQVASFGKGISIGESPTFAGLAGGNIVEGNTVHTHVGGPDANGILVLSGHNLIIDNVVKNYNDNGIRVSGVGNVLERNISANNQGNGIFLFGSATNAVHVKDNYLTGNGNCAIKIEAVDSNSYRGNIGAGNGLSGSSCIPSGNDDLGGNHGL